MSKQQQSKDNFEPFELNNPIPWPVIAIALALAAWGIFTFLHSYMAAGENQQQAQQQAQQAGAEKSQGSGNAKAATDGAQLFDNYCSSCHQNNGAGVSGAIPPLAGSSWVLGDGEQVASIVLFGISGPISVQGKTFNGRMPTFGSTLSNGEIAAIVNHIRSSWGNSAGPINAELVQVQRERFSDRTIPWQGGAELRSHFNPTRTAEGN